MLYLSILALAAGLGVPIAAFGAALGQGKIGAAALEGIARQPEATGRPAYHPATMLKIYLYGYLNRIQSTRRLEHEARRISS